MDGEHRAVHGHAALVVAAPPAVIARRRAVVEPAGEHRLDVRQSRNAACRADRAAHAYHARALHCQRAETGDGRRGRRAAGDLSDDAADVDVVVTRRARLYDVEVDVEERGRIVQIAGSRHMSDDAARHDVAAGDGEVEGIVVQMSVQIVLPRRRRAEGRGRADKVAGVERRRNAAENDVGIVCAPHRDVAHPSRLCAFRAADRAAENVAVCADIGAVVAACERDVAVDDKVGVVDVAGIACYADYAAEDLVAAARKGDVLRPSDIDAVDVGADFVADIARAADIDADRAVDDVVAREAAAAGDVELDVGDLGAVDRDEFAVDVASNTTQLIGSAALQRTVDVIVDCNGVTAAVKRDLGRGEHYAVGIGAHGQVARDDRRRRACGNRLVRAGVLLKPRAERVAAEEEPQRVLTCRAVRVVCGLIDAYLVYIAERDGLRVIFGVVGVIDDGQPGSVARNGYRVAADRRANVRNVFVVDDRLGGTSNVGRIDRKSAAERAVNQRAVVVGNRRRDVEIGRVLRDDGIAADHRRGDIPLRRRRAVRPAQQGRRVCAVGEPPQVVLGVGHQDYHAQQGSVGLVRI